MIEGIREPVESRRDLQQLLFEGKVSAPAVLDQGVSRRRLIESARASGSRVVGITAPAGYGKSTMLAEWAQLEDRPIAWATVDRFDDDPAALLSVLATACSTISEHAAEIVSEMTGVGASALGRSAPLLAAALKRTKTPFVLLVDDLHLADSLSCQDVLEIVLTGVPRGSQVVLASRHRQPHLARLRAGGDAYDIGTAELRLDADGARRIFERAHAEVDEAQLAAIVDRCEGWPTGLFLSALVARAGGDALAATGDDQFVAEYLYRECIGRLSEEMQRFLRRTAVLEQLSSAVCDALLETTDSSARLRQLETMNLFLVPVDRRGGWFRYHAVFRDFLLAELRAHEPGAIAGLHVRAADWFEDHRFPEQAIEHLLAAGDRDRSVRLVATLALPTYQSGQAAVLERWLSELGDTAVESHPPLMAMAAWKGLLLGESAVAEHWMLALDEVDWSDAPVEQRLALDSRRAMIRAATCAAGPEQALADAAFAVSNEPAWSPWRALAVHLHGAIHLLVGDVGAARRAFVESATVAPTMGSTGALLLSEAELAILALDAGRWQVAREHVRVALATIESHHLEGYSTTALALAAAARVALHFGDGDGAERYLARAMRARVQCSYVMPFVSLKVRLQLATAFVELGDHVSATHLMREMQDVIGHRPKLGLLLESVAVLQDRLERMSGWKGASPLTPAEIRLLPYLQTHLTIGEIGERLFISRNTVSSEVGSIYRKLDATTRSAAVERAIAVGLLGG